jgi:stress responsive alpha/beta barrel protein
MKSHDDRSCDRRARIEFPNECLMATLRALMKMISILMALGLAIGVAVAQKYDAKEKGGKGKLLHVVSFKFKESATKEQIKQVEDSFRGLKKKIKEIKEYQWGTNVSPEKHDKGFTHGFILTFNTEKDRDAYLVHPDHKEFGKALGPVLADVFVIDFWAQD